MTADQSCPKCAQKHYASPSPFGEGGPKGRMRVDLLPSPAASRHPLPEGEGPREKQVSFLRMFCKTCSAWVSGDSPKVIGTGLVKDRPYSTVMDPVTFIHSQLICCKFLWVDAV